MGYRETEDLTMLNLISEKGQRDSYTGTFSVAYRRHPHPSHVKYTDRLFKINIQWQHVSEKLQLYYKLRISSIQSKMA